jgi:molybdopterin converting factor small subunit
MADVHLPRSLVALFPGAPRRLEARGATVAAVIADLDMRVPGIRNRLLDAGPSIRTHINIFVAGERAMLSTPVPDGATVHVIPAVSGGTYEPMLEVDSMEERFIPAVAVEGRPITSDETEGAPGAAPPADVTGLDDPRALQILSTEHWSLLTARSLVYNESFTRVGMFFSILSATLVALGLVSTGTGFSDAFLIVTAFVLALDLFIGLATLGRVGAVSDEEMRYTQGMNRLRNAYFRIVPGLDPYFITSQYDDFNSVAAFYGPPTVGPIGNMLHGLTTLPGMLSVVCCAIGAALAAVLLLLVTRDGTTAFAGAAFVFLGMFLVMGAIGMRTVARFQSTFVAKFPRPTDPPSGR